MSREVDVKALVSHIVRGDGLDRCRICMGDTSEGQVHLDDTVMMDGDKPITLAELLESVTGVQVEMDYTLPMATCRPCFDQTLAVVNFKTLCAQSAQRWRDATSVFLQIHDATDSEKAYIVFYTNEKTVIESQTERLETVADALVKLNSKPKKISKEKPKRSLVKLPCTCPDCGKKFGAPDKLNSHLKNTLKRSCEQCAVVLPKNKLAKHYVNHNLVVFTCDICFDVFEDHETLEEHLAKSHTSNSQYLCNICGNEFTNDRSLRAHQYFHSLYHCKSCNSSFENVKCFIHHQKLCKPVKQPQFKSYKCHDCGVVYDRKPSLRVHIVQKHLNVLPYVCQTCGKRTSTLPHLKSHEKIHKTERKVYQCYCGAKLRTELGYQLHQRIHTGERPYECEFCGFRYLSASRRLDHIKRRHRGSDQMPYACSKCSARFVRPCELKKHYLAVHYSVVDVTPAKREVDPVTRRLRNTYKVK